MAVVTRYFSTAAAGSGDGTTWTDRAKLFDAGEWSSIIKSFDFSTTDALRCLIGTGDYSITKTLQASSFANPPDSKNTILLAGCDAGGVGLEPPDTKWVSSQPPWDTSSLPVLNSTVQPINLPRAGLRLLKINGSTSPAATAAAIDWCNMTASSEDRCATVGIATNSIFATTANGFNQVAGVISLAYNNRIVGNSSASTRDRRGISSEGYAVALVAVGNTLLNCPGEGIRVVASNSISGLLVCKNIIAGCGDGLVVGIPVINEFDKLISVSQNIIKGCTRVGIKHDGPQSNLLVTSNRLRDNGTADIQIVGNSIVTQNNTSAGLDADEFADHSVGDFRIKHTSALWGTGLGPGDELPSPEQIAEQVWTRAGRSLT